MHPPTHPPKKKITLVGPRPTGDIDRETSPETSTRRQSRRRPGRPRARSARRRRTWSPWDLVIHIRTKKEEGRMRIPRGRGEKSDQKIETCKRNRQTKPKQIHDRLDRLDDNERTNEFEDQPESEKKKKINKKKRKNSLQFLTSSDPRPRRRRSRRRRRRRGVSHLISDDFHLNVKVIDPTSRTRPRHPEPLNNVRCARVQWHTLNDDARRSDRDRWE